MESKSFQDGWVKMRGYPQFRRDDEGLANAKVDAEKLIPFVGVSTLEEKLGSLSHSISKRAHSNAETLDLRGPNWKESKPVFLKFLENASWVHLPNMKSLLFSKAIGIPGIECIVKAKQQGHLPKLSALQFNSNDMKDEGVKILMRAAESGHMHTMEVLTFREEGLTQDAILALAKAMEAGYLENLQTLMFQSKCIGDAIGEAVARALMSGFTKSLTALGILVDSKLGQAGLTALALALQKDGAPSLNELLLYFPAFSPIPKEGTQALAQAMRSGHLSKLETLELHGFQEGEILVDGLAGGEFAGLRSLSMLHCSLGKDAATAIADQLKLGRWAPSFKLLDLSFNPLGDDGIKALAEGLAGGHVNELQSLHLYATEMHDEGASSIAGVLARESNSLPSLKEVDLQGNEITKTSQAALASAYKQNPLLTATLRAPWPKWSEFSLTYEESLKSNEKNKEVVKILRECKEKVPAMLARVFLCGEGQVGKTSLRKSLVDAFSDSYVRRPQFVNSVLSFVACEPKRTRGIELSSISSEGPNSLTLSIWDLAGPEEYHGLHAAFFPEAPYKEAQATLFVVLIRDEGASPKNAPLKSLEYWLKFIASSSLRGMEESKRRVLVVLNNYRGLIPRSNSLMDSRCSEKVKERFQDFMQIEFYETSFDVRVVDRAKDFGDKLFSTAGQLLLSKEIPQISVDLERELNSWGEQHKNFPILTHKTVEDIVTEWNSKDTSLPDENHRTINAALRFLNEAGSIIFIPEGALSDGGLAETYLVVANPAWFCRKVVGDLLLPQDQENRKRKFQEMKGDEYGSIGIHDLKEKTFEELGLDDTQMQQIITVLLHLGLCFESSQERIFVPGLAPRENRFPKWWNDFPKAEKRQWVMGLSLEHINADKTLMPVSLFYKFQALLVQNSLIQTAIGGDFHVGPNFLAFKAVGMKVLVEFGTKTSGRIDFLVKPSEAAQCTEAKGEEVRRRQVSLADKLVRMLEDARRSCYPGIQLELKVIKPWSACSRHLEMEERVDRQPLQKILKGLLDIEIDCKGGWKNKIGTEWTVGQDEFVDEVKRTDLLRAEELSAWAKHVAKREAEEIEKIQSLNAIISKFSGNSKMGLTQESLSKQSPWPLSNTDETPGVEERHKTLEDSVASMEVKISNLQELLSGCQESLIKCFANQKVLWLRVVSLEALSFEDRERSIPRYAYCKESGSGGWMRTFTEVFKRSVTLHFLCESRHDNGSLHEVPTQVGYDITLTSNWMQKNESWLNWSLCIASVGVSFGTAMIPGLNAIASTALGGALQFAQTAMGDFETPTKIMEDLGSTSAQNPTAVKGPSKESLQELIGEENLTPAFIKEKFKLTMVLPQETGTGESGHVLWVCDECLDKDKLQKKYHIIESSINRNLSGSTDMYSSKLKE